MRIKKHTIDLRFQCFGDTNKFYTNNEVFSLNYTSYYTDNIDGVKQFFEDYLDQLWRDGNHFYNRLALYVKDIIDMNDTFKIMVDAALFVDDSLL